MYPYDFVRIDWKKGVKRRRYAPHDSFSGLSGRIQGTITTLTPFFIPQHKSRISRRDLGRSLKPFLANGQNQPIIPGSSLKGLTRSLVETVGYGCWWLFKGEYPAKEKGKKVNYQNELPGPFHQCQAKEDLCVACRMFGLTQGDKVSLLGHVGFDDAICEQPVAYQAIYTIILSDPKPRHTAFYLDKGKHHLAGRKFYYHHSVLPRDVGGWKISSRSKRQNQYIKPIDADSVFTFSAHFDNLAQDELGLLLYALALEPGMRHKLGSAKPAGLGSVEIALTRLEIIDYHQRYTAPGGGKTVYEEDALGRFVDGQIAPFVNDTTSVTLQDLRRIWKWPGRNDIKYPRYYWFQDNPTTRLSGTP